MVQKILFAVMCALLAAVAIMLWIVLAKIAPIFVVLL